MVFAEEVFGGSVPKNFFPAVEKGLREACVHGPLAGYPVVNLKAVLYDGSYHPVDSSEIAFKTAAQLAYKAVSYTHLLPCRKRVPWACRQAGTKGRPLCHPNRGAAFSRRKR